MAKDAGAAEHERANAEVLKARLQQQLKDAGAPAGNRRVLPSWPAAEADRRHGTSVTEGRLDGWRLLARQSGAPRVEEVVVLEPDGRSPERE